MFMNSTFSCPLRVTSVMCTKKKTMKECSWMWFFENNVCEKVKKLVRKNRPFLHVGQAVKNDCGHQIYFHRYEVFEVINRCVEVCTSLYEKTCDGPNCNCTMSMPNISPFRGSSRHPPMPSLDAKTHVWQVPCTWQCHLVQQAKRYPSLLCHTLFIALSLSTWCTIKVIIVVINIVISSFNDVDLLHIMLVDCCVLCCQECCPIAAIWQWQPPWLINSITLYCILPSFFI